MNNTGAIFLDRDGVINENNSEHIKHWDEFHFIPGALHSIRELTGTGLPIFVVTNQAAVNRRLMTVDILNDIHEQMQVVIAHAGGKITKVYYCPHDTEERCGCRKPAAGMLLQAAAEFNIDLSQSFMVGDAWTDVAAAVEVGARAVLLMTGRGRWNIVPALDRFGLNFNAAVDLADAAQMIKAALDGNSMNSPERLRKAYAMALRVQDAWVV